MHTTILPLCAKKAGGQANDVIWLTPEYEKMQNAWHRLLLGANVGDPLTFHCIQTLTNAIPAVNRPGMTGCTSKTIRMLRTNVRYISIGNLRFFVYKNSAAKVRNRKSPTNWANLYSRRSFAFCLKISTVCVSAHRFICF